MRTTTIVELRACDTTWRIGARREEDAQRARATVLELERRLNAFDAASAVARFAREGHVRDPHVATLLRRAAAYRDATGGAFDITRGSLERAIKAHLRGEAAAPTDAGAAASWRVEGDDAWCDAPLDLNGIAKGHIVDQARAAMRGPGFVDGGGDIAGPVGPIGVEAPDGRVIGVLATPWNVATSGNAKRRRGDVDHLYDPRSGRVGARHAQVTVVAKRDCVEADVLATTLAVLPIEEGYALVERWPGIEALWWSEQGTIASAGFEDHVWKP